MMLYQCDGNALQSIADWLSATAPEGTATAVDWIGPSTAYDADEEMAISLAVEHRQNEFRTGRRLAREAIGRLGCGAISLPPDKDRVPRWPDGFLGTISHAASICVVMVGRMQRFLGMGIDIEDVDEDVAALEDVICRPEERSSSNSHGFAVDSTLLRFVAKEAFYKAYFPAIRRFVEFQDLWVRFDLPRNQFIVEILSSQLPSLGGSRVFRGSFKIAEKHVVAGIWICRE